MSLTTTGGASILTPDQVDALIVRPFSQESVALRTSTVVPINPHTLRIPVVTSDPVAGFVAEGAENSATDPTLTEVNITPSKLAGLVVISAELAADSSPAALQVVGDGLVRDLARKTDAAYFGNMTTNGPPGCCPSRPPRSTPGTPGQTSTLSRKPRRTPRTTTPWSIRSSPARPPRWRSAP